MPANVDLPQCVGTTGLLALAAERVEYTVPPNVPLVGPFSPKPMPKLTERARHILFAHLKGFLRRRLALTSNSDRVRRAVIPWRAGIRRSILVQPGFDVDQGSGRWGSTSSYLASAGKG